MRYDWILIADDLRDLAALGAPEPDMPPYDPSKHEPIEESDIDVEPGGEQTE